MNIAFRLLAKEDASIYKDARLNSYQHDPYAFSESYEDEKGKAASVFAEELIIKGDPPEWFVLGAFSEKNELTGFVKFRRDLRSKARHKSMIHAMYVHPEFRSFGVGKQLVDEAINRARNLNGLEQIHLWVLHSDLSNSASDFYIKCGFERQGPLVKKDLKIGEAYIDAEYMVMHL
ncbi:MAG: GNAT family N-acetyltransferase [Cyclobacteriaceae bacterium]